MAHPLSAAPCAFGRRSTLAIGLLLGLAGASGVHAQTPGFHPLGFAPNTSFSTARGLSADGRVATGYSGDFRGFVWSESTGRYDINTVQSDGNFSGLAISGDGTTVTGARGNTQAVRWSGPGTAQNLGFLPTYDRSVGSAVSGDGSIVVGRAYSSTQARSQAFRWTAGTGMVGLGFAGPTHNESLALDVSSNGSTIVGYSRDFVTGDALPFAWSDTAGMQVLANLPGRQSASAVSVNANGSIIVGTSDGLGVIWNAGVPTSLGLAPGYIRSSAFSVSDDGSVVLGSVSNVSNGTVAVWTPTTGFVPFADYLALHGITIPDGYSIREVTDMSDDGRTFCGEFGQGNLPSQAFVATVPSPTSLVGVLVIASLSVARRRRRVASITSVLGATSRRL